jgi:hypothetical protein
MGVAFLHGRLRALGLVCCGFLGAAPIAGGLGADDCSLARVSAVQEARAGLRADPEHGLRADEGVTKSILSPKDLLCSDDVPK